jgi:two-component system response regulator GlrR
MSLQAEKEGLEESIRFSPEALDYLVSMPWPGNVRQLQNVIEQCSVLSISPVIPLTLVKRALRENEKGFQTLSAARLEFDHNYLHRVLRMWNGDTVQAAEVAGFKDKLDEFKQLLSKHQIDPLQFRRFQDEDAADEIDSIKQL